jgi:hypothetical protein
MGAMELVGDNANKGRDNGNSVKSKMKYDI